MTTENFQPHVAELFDNYINENTLGRDKSMIDEFANPVDFSIRSSYLSVIPVEMTISLIV